MAPKCQTEWHSDGGSASAQPKHRVRLRSTGSPEHRRNSSNRLLAHDCPITSGCRHFSYLFDARGRSEIHRVSGLRATHCPLHSRGSWNQKITRRRNSPVRCSVSHGDWSVSRLAANLPPASEPRGVEPLSAYASASCPAPVGARIYPSSARKARPHGPLSELPRACPLTAKPERA